MDINSILAASLNMEEKFSISMTTLLTGFVVVFAVLILLIVIIAIYGKIVYSAQNRTAKKKKEKQEAENKAVTNVKPAVTPAQTTVSGISDEIVAVIAAAVDSTYGVGNARITGIKKSVSAGRPVWGQAGVLDNTRPF